MKANQEIETPEIDRMDREEKKTARRRLGWIAAGFIVSLIASVLYMVGCTSLNRNVKSEGKLDTPLETQETANWLMAQAYVIYHDLMQSQSPEELGYEDIYVNPKEGCEWVLDEQRYAQFIMDGAVEPSEDVASAYAFLQYLREEYFFGLEEQFSQINNTFDYFCEDLSTAATVSNLSAGNGIMSSGQYFYVALLFDQNGNCKVEDVVCGNDADLMRKLLNEAVRNVRLTSDSPCFTLGGPVNCRVVYSISKEDWEKYETGERRLRLHGDSYNLLDTLYIGYFSDGITHLLLIFWLFVVILAFFLPVSIKRMPENMGSPESKWLRIPLELLYCLICIGFSLGLSTCFRLTFAILNGEAGAVLGRIIPQTGIVNEILVYGVTLLFFMANYFVAWYLGMNLRDIRRLGIWGYIKERSLIYRFFPFIKSKMIGLYDMLVHIDVTKKANKLIIRLLLINGIVLFFISSLWFGGFGITVVYSIFLYFILRKYLSDLQKKYNLFLRATNEIAEGNLNVQLKEDWGVFEPFKPQVYRIQDGFKKAVEEEVKSQRMKAELITNVSHDLKTPLTAIITYINLLKEENLTKEQQKEYLDTLERKSLRLKALIEDLFEVSKANSQSMSLNIMDVDIMNLVRQVAFEMEDKMTERNLDLRLVLSEEKAVLPLDSQRTYRIYENLFNNIVKYAMPGTRVYVNGFLVENQVIITLKNITAEEISVNPEELTDRFVRGDASRNTEGSGLGLAIAKSFTGLQGGELTIEVDGDLFKVTTAWHRK